MPRLSKLFRYMPAQKPSIVAHIPRTWRALSVLVLRPWFVQGSLQSPHRRESPHRFRVQYESALYRSREQILSVPMLKKATRLVL